MRQPEPEWRQAMLLEAGHFAKSARMPIRQEDRVVAKSGRAARRPHQGAVGAGLDLFEMAVRPGDAQCGNEMRAALRGLRGAALLQQPFDPGHGDTEILV